MQSTADVSRVETPQQAEEQRLELILLKREHAPLSPVAFVSPMILWQLELAIGFLTSDRIF